MIDPNNVTQKRYIELLQHGYAMYHDMELGGYGKITVRFEKAGELIAECTGTHHGDRRHMQDLADTLTRYVTKLAWIHYQNEKRESALG